jgi:hypothetical protein
VFGDRAVPSAPSRCIEMGRVGCDGRWLALAWSQRPTLIRELPDRIRLT